MVNNLTDTEDLTRRFRSVAALIASASIISGSPTLVDRVINALSPEAVIRSLGDSLRIVENALKSDREPSIREEKVREKENDEEKTVPTIIIKVKEDDKTETYKIRYASLPSSEIVRDFMEKTYNNVLIARKIGILAQSMILEAEREI
jgi:CRISPR type I-A-associated protein Csa5